MSECTHVLLVILFVCQYKVMLYFNDCLIHFGSRLHTIHNYDDHQQKSLSLALMIHIIAKYCDCTVIIMYMYIHA